MTLTFTASWTPPMPTMVFPRNWPSSSFWDPQQKKAWREQLREGRFTSGEATLYFPSDGAAAAQLSNKNGNDSALTVSIPEGVPVEEMLWNDRRSPPPGLSSSPGNRRRRRLGTEKMVGSYAFAILVVDDTDPVTAPLAADKQNATLVSDTFLGASGPSMKQQLYDCSLGNFEAVPAVNELGVFYVTVESTNTEHYIIKNRAVEELLGLVTWNQYLSIDYLIFIIEECYVQQGTEDCAWAATAIANGYEFIVKQDYYKMVGVQIHELGTYV